MIFAGLSYGWFLCSMLNVWWLRGAAACDARAFVALLVRPRLWVDSAARLQSDSSVNSWVPRLPSSLLVSAVVRGPSNFMTLVVERHLPADSPVRRLQETCCDVEESDCSI